MGGQWIRTRLGHCKDLTCGSECKKEGCHGLWLGTLSGQDGGGSVGWGVQGWPCWGRGLGAEKGRCPQGRCL